MELLVSIFVNLSQLQLYPPLFKTPIQACVSHAVHSPFTKNKVPLANLTPLAALETLFVSLYTV